MLLNLITRMKSLGLRSYEVAATIGISESRLSRVINGRGELTEDERARLAQVLDASSELLFKETANVPPPNFAERVLAEWKNSEALRDEFDGNFLVFVAFKEAEEAGRTSVCPPHKSGATKD